jgi:hypothetical protein
MLPDGPFNVGVSYSFKSYFFNEAIHFYEQPAIHKIKELERKVIMIKYVNVFFWFARSQLPFSPLSFKTQHRLQQCNHLGKLILNK